MDHWSILGTQKYTILGTNVIFQKLKKFMVIDNLPMKWIPSICSSESPQLAGVKEKIK